MILQGLSWFQRLRLPASTTGSMESVPGWGTRIPYSLWCDQKKEKNGLKKKKPQQYQVLARTQSLWSAPILLVRTQEGKPAFPKVQDGFHFGTSLAGSQVKHMYFHKLNNSTAKYLLKISGEVFPCRYLCEMNYGSCIRHTQPNLETSQVSFSR